MGSSLSQTGGRHDVVTGAFGYTGHHITAQLLARGRRVRTLTGHPNRPNPFGDRVEVARYSFVDHDRLIQSLSDADTLYNTYWIRFGRGGIDFEDAVRNSARLFHAASRAGVRRIVHVSITKPSLDSPLPYFRGKAQVEQALAGCGVPYGIVRPTLVFGEGDILINNIAWLLRRFPVFGIPGSGAYRVRPVSVEDVARLCLETAAMDDNVVIDAVGPEVFTFVEMVRQIRNAVRSRALLTRMPMGLVRPLVGLLGLAVHDVLLTPDELAGLADELITTDGPTTGPISFSGWLKQHAALLGVKYASELDRHFRGGDR